MAREVAERGWSVAVLEADRVAWAASGRNTGFVLPGFAEDVSDMIERVGLDHTKQLWALSEQGLAYVRRTVEGAEMPGVDPVPGWLAVSKTDNAAAQRAEVERLRWIGADVTFWPTEQVRAVLPNPRYFGAAHYPSAFHIHPLNYALGLAALAEKAGARIFEGTPALAIDPAGVRKRIVTPMGRLRAAHVVLAGNVHLGRLVPRLAATLLPLTTFVIVTEPIANLADVVKFRGAVSDGERADNHYRIVGGERLALESLHPRRGEQVAEQHILARPFHRPPPALVARDVDHREEGPVDPRRRGFVRRHPRGAHRQIGIEAGGFGDRHRKDGAMAMDHVGSEDQRDLEA